MLSLSKDFTIKEDWANLEKVRNAHNSISYAMTKKFEYFERKQSGFFNQLIEHKRAKDRDWNRKLFIEAKTSAVLQQLSIAENLLGTGNIQAALNKANAIWEDIKDRGESPTKKLCRNIIVMLSKKKVILKGQDHSQKRTTDVITMI
jgi:hypothetical protein